MALRQGQGDGLCGLYSLANFLENQRVWGKCDQGSPDSTLRYLLQVCEDKGWLTALKLCYGFDGPEIVFAANAIFEQYHLHFKSAIIEATDLPIDNLETLATRKSLKALIVGNEKHWVLLSKGSASKFSMYDSWTGKTEKIEKMPTDYVLNGAVVLWSFPRERVVV